MPDSSTMTTWEMYRSLLLSVYLPSFLMSICNGSVMLILPLFALDVGASAGTASLVFAMLGLGNMVSDVPAGYAASRLGDKATMLIGVGLMAVTAGFASQSGTAFELGIAAFFFGGAMSTWLLARLTHISEAVPRHHRGKAISTMAGLARVGSLIGPVASGFIADGFGFGAVFAGVAVVSAVSFLLIIVAVPVNRKGHHEESPSMLRLIPHIVSSHTKIFATAGTAVLLLTILRAGRSLLIPLWGNAIGLDAADIGLIVGASAAVDMTLFPLAGLMMDNWGRKHAAITCMTLLSAGVACVPLTSTFFGLMFAAMLAGLGNGLGSGINMTLGADFAPPRERGEFLGVWRLMGDSGSFVGPMLMGYISGAFVLSGAFAVTAAFGLSGALIVALFVRETLQKQDAQ